MTKKRDLNDRAQHGQRGDEGIDLIDIPPEGTDEPFDDVPIDAYDDLPSGRPRIVIGTRADLTLAETIRAVRLNDDVFARGLGLVRVVPDELGGKTIFKLGEDALIPLLSKVADFVQLKVKAKRKASAKVTAANSPDAQPEAPEMEEKEIQPPASVARSLARCGEYSGVRVLDGIATQPILHVDGTVFSVPGYDPVTHLWYEPEGEAPKFRPHPTQEDAKRGAKLILDVVDEFPFVGDADRSAFLAAMLSPIGRPAFRGPCPAFVHSANMAGSGKGRLAEIECVVAIGDVPEVTPLPEAEQEQEKTLRTIAFAGRPVALLDNITGSIGGAALDAYLTATRFSGRVLGTTDLRNVPARTVLLMTSNATTYRADTTRRVIPIRLESKTARPEERAFKIADIVGHAREKRLELYAAAMDILRAYMLAGRPAYAMKAFGSYEGWSALIRGALLYAGQADPLGTRDGIEQQNTDTTEHGRLVAYLAARFNGAEFTVSEIANDADEVSNRLPNMTICTGWTIQDLRDLLDELNCWDRSARKVNRKSLGWRVVKFDNRPTLAVPSQRLTRTGKFHPSTKVPIWRVR